MQQKSIIRESNFEIMRVISMLFIVFFHAFLHGKIFDYVSESSLMFFRILESILLVHVNSFILLSGYFQSKSNFKMSKLIKLNNQAWFYRSIVIVILIIFNFVSATKLEILREIFPLPIVNYWFIGIYILLYCVSPFLNKLIEVLEKKEYQKLLIAMFIIMSIIPTITGNTDYNNRGFSFSNFIFLYFIGAYLRKYPMNDSFLFKKFSNSAKRLLYIFMMLFFALFNVSIFFLSYKLGDNFLFEEIGKNIRTAYEAYNNPLIIIQTIFYFSIFTTMSFKSKIVNKIGSLTFGVYLFHDNKWIQPYIFKWLGLSNLSYSFLDTIIKLIISCFLIFIISIILEGIRQMIFKFIYNRKISKKYRVWYRSKIKKIGFEINW